MTPPIRIAHVSGPLALAGSERQALALAERLPKERFAVDFILLAGEGPLGGRAREIGAGVFSIGAPERAGMPFPAYAARTSGHVARFIRLMRRRRYDIVDAWLFPAYTIAGLTRPLTRIPALIAGRRSLSDYKDNLGVGQRLVDRIAERASDVIVANGKAVAADVLAREQVDPGKLRVIRNGVVIPPAPNIIERDRLRAEWGAGPDDAVIGCVANYKVGKGLELLLEALGPRLRQPNPPLLVLVGEGPLRGSLASIAERLGIAPRVRIIGAVLDTRPLYGAFDMTVSASESEGLPNALLEGAAAGLPIVTTDAGGSREVVLDGTTGIVVPVRDAAALGRAIDALLGDPTRRREMGDRAREHVTRSFGMDRMADAFAALYEEVAGRNRQRD